MLIDKLQCPVQAIEVDDQILRLFVGPGRPQPDAVAALAQALDPRVRVVGVFHGNQPFMDVRKHGGAWVARDLNVAAAA